MNVTKLLMRLLWPFWMLELAKPLGFKTPKALAYGQKAADFHKAWEMLHVYLQAAVTFRVGEYQQSTRKSRLLPTARGAMEHMVSLASPSRWGMAMLVFRYLLSILMLRKCTRVGNSEMAVHAHAILGELFYWNNMTTYMELHFRDMVTRLKSPPPIQQFLKEDQGFNTDRLEGGGLVLESRNRRTTMWTSPGVPTHQQWLDSVEKVRIWFRRGPM